MLFLVLIDFWNILCILLYIVSDYRLVNRGSILVRGKGFHGYCVTILRHGMLSWRHNELILRHKDLVCLWQWNIVPSVPAFPEFCVSCLSVWEKTYFGHKTLQFKGTCRQHAKITVCSVYVCLSHSLLRFAQNHQVAKLKHTRTSLDYQMKSPVTKPFLPLPHI
jgi:hypothetical protein